MRKAPDQSVDPPEGRFLKCKVDCVFPDGGSVSLSLPESRVTKEKLTHDELSVLETLDGFKVQKFISRIHPFCPIATRLDIQGSQ